MLDKIPEREHKIRENMGKRGRTNKTPNASPGFHNPISLREEATGRKQTKAGSKNAKSMLKLEHLQELATWASREAAIPSLGAFFGQRLATVTEAMGERADPSLFSCERFVFNLHLYCSFFFLVGNCL